MPHEAHDSVSFGLMLGFTIFLNPGMCALPIVLDSQSGVWNAVSSLSQSASWGSEESEQTLQEMPQNRLGAGK